MSKVVIWISYLLGRPCVSSATNFFPISAKKEAVPCTNLFYIHGALLPCLDCNCRERERVCVCVCARACVCACVPNYFSVKCEFFFFNFDCTVYRVASIMQSENSRFSDT
jgi:hypothetical protein